MRRLVLVCGTMVLFAAAITTVGKCAGDSRNAAHNSAPEVDSFALATYKGSDLTPDTKGSGTGYVVDSTITVRAHSIGMSRIDVHAYRYSIDLDTITASGEPDKDGWVTLSLELPIRGGSGYVVDADGVLMDQTSPGTHFNGRNEHIVPVSGFHVIVEESDS